MDRLPRLSEPAGGGRARIRLYPFELAAGAGLATAIVYLRSRGLRIDWRTFEYTVPPLVPVMARYLVIGVALYSLYLSIRHRTVRPYWRRIGSASWLGLTLRLWAAIIAFTYTYFWLKVCVPLVNPRLWDERLWQLDRLVHGGFSPSIFLIELTRGTGLVELLDRWYSWWLPSMSLGIAFLMAHPAATVRRRFTLSCVLIWMLGAWLYVGLPALGPIYVYPEHWQEVTAEIPRARAAQELLWDNYERVLAGRTGGLKRFNPTRGIAALPSLHVGAHWLLMLWARRYLRPLFAPALVGTGLTFLGSVVTGWHYAVDGYLGVILGQLSFWLANRTERAGPDHSPKGATGRRSEGIAK